MPAQVAPPRPSSLAPASPHAHCAPPSGLPGTGREDNEQPDSSRVLVAHATRRVARRRGRRGWGRRRERQRGRRSPGGEIMERCEPGIDACPGEQGKRGAQGSAWLRPVSTIIFEW